MKQIIVNVGDLTIEEKQRVNKSLAKIKNIRMCNPMHWDKAAVMYGPSIDRVNVGFDYRKVTNPTHTQQQVLEMSGMEKQGHVHAELMAQYAEDAKTHAEPWRLWQVESSKGAWSDCEYSPAWATHLDYRHKPKTHIVNGVEVPDLRVEPKNGQEYWYPHASIDSLAWGTVHGYESLTDSHRIANNLCYEPTEDGKQAAILHAKAWLGIA